MQIHRTAQMRHDLDFLARMLGITGLCASLPPPVPNRAAVEFAMADPVANARAHQHIQDLLDQLPSESHGPIMCARGCCAPVSPKGARTCGAGTRECREAREAHLRGEPCGDSRCTICGDSARAQRRIGDLLMQCEQVERTAAFPHMGATIRAAYHERIGHVGACATCNRPFGYPAGVTCQQQERHAPPLSRDN